MLFDLRGKRRRLVQVVYLTLAVLMGGGLVLFGIGGDVSGGLVDAFTGGGGGNSGGGTSLIDKRVEKNEKAVTANPKNAVALKALARDHYQLALEDADQQGNFGSTGKQELAKAGAAWQKYLALNPPKVDDSLAGLMINAYETNALNDPAEAAGAAEVVANARPSAAAYLRLMQFAQAAGQTRKATLAGVKAVELAPKSQRKIVKQQVDAIKAGAATAQPTG
jgi:hypothetical protein